MPTGYEYLGSSLIRFGSTLQGIADRRRQAGIRADLIRADEEMFSVYQSSRRKGDFNPEALFGEYEAQLTGIQNKHGVRTGEEPLYTTARAGFSRMLEGETTRRAIADERAQVIDDSIRVGRGYSEELRKNPDMSLQDMDNLAGRMSEGIVSIIDPTAGEEARSRTYDRMLASGRDLMRAREKRAADLANTQFSLGVAEDIDRIETLQAAGAVPALGAIKQATELRNKLSTLPVTAATASARKDAGDLVLRLTKKARERAGSEVDLTTRLYAEATVDSIERRHEARDITVEEAIAEANMLRKKLADQPITSETVQGRNTARNLITRLIREKTAGTDEEASEDFNLSVETEIDKIEESIADGSLTLTDGVQAAEGLASSLETLPGEGDTSAVRDQVRNLVTRLKKQEKEEGENSVENVIKLETQTEIGRIERFVTSKDITSAEGLVYAKELEKELASLPVDDSTIALRKELNGLVNRLTAGKVSAAAEQEELQYTYAAERVNTSLITAEAKDFESLEELHSGMQEAADAIKKLPEDSPSRVAKKSAFYKRILAVGGKFADKAQKQIEELKETSLTIGANAIERDIRERRILTSEALSSRINDLEKSVRNGGAPESLKRSLSNRSLSLKSLHETVLKNRTLQPSIDTIRAEVDAKGPTANATSIINLMNRRVDEVGEENDLTPSQIDLFRTTAFHQLRPEFAQAVDNSYDREYVRGESEINHIFERAHNSLDTGRDFNPEKVGQELEALFENAPEELERDLRANVVQDAANKLSAKAQDLALAELREQNKTVVEDKIQEMSLDIRDNPDNLEDSWAELRSDIISSDLAPEMKEELMKEASNTLLEQHIFGRVNNFLDAPPNRDELPKLARQLKTEELYTGIDVEEVVERAEREWRREFTQQSRALVDQRIDAIELGTDEDRALVNRDPRFTPEDRARYNSAFVKAHEERLNADSFQDKVNEFGRVSMDDADEYNAWYKLNDGQSLIHNEPASIIPYIAKAGYMTKEIVRDVWRTVSLDIPENADKMLQTLSLVEGVNPEVLPASLSKAQHAQYTFWKYSRTNADSIVDTITRVRAFNNDAQTAVRAARGADYNRLAGEAEYASREELSDVIGIEDAKKDSIGIAYAQRDFLELHRMYYLNGMEWDDAEDAAADMVKRDWGKNTDGSLMYLPPEKTGAQRLFNADTGEFDYGWVEGQLQEDVRLLPSAEGIPEDSNLLLFADDQSRRERNARTSVSYLVRYTREDGVIDFVRGRNNVLRYVPLPSKERVAGQKEAFGKYVPWYSKPGLDLLFGD